MPVVSLHLAKFYVELLMRVRCIQIFCLAFSLAAGSMPQAAAAAVSATRPGSIDAIVTDLCWGLAVSTIAFVLIVWLMPGRKAWSLAGVHGRIAGAALARHGRHRRDSLHSGEQHAERPDDGHGSTSGARKRLSAILGAKDCQTGPAGVTGQGNGMIWLQPRVDVTTATIMAYEILPASDHTQGSPVLPCETEEDARTFAKPTGARMRMIAEACRLSRLLPDKRFIVQLGTLSLHDLEWLSELEGILRHRDGTASRIELEIAQDILIDDVRVARGVAEGIRRLGFGLALRVTAADNASLACLDQYPVDTIRIDRSLVVDLAVADAARERLEGYERRCRRGGNDRAGTVPDTGRMRCVAGRPHRSADRS
ncbi:EAL domain-containing protein [Neorhizobium sp. NPDC001467]|uniref:EAL domain-containing protein n=1 Tax=Neorhizobium sp. NPDC001467 TaxID=3390595 RepID=UPI003D026760